MDRDEVVRVRSCEISARPLYRWRFAETIDVPTIADELDATLPSEWKFDGSSLLAPSPHRLPPTRFFKGSTPEFVQGARAARMGAWIRKQMIGQSHDSSDFYRLAPYGALVGRPVAGLGPIAELDGATARIAAAASYRDVRPDTGRLPAMLRARLSGVGDGAWRSHSTRRSPASGPVPQNDQLQAAAMLNPDFFAPGRTP